MLFFTLNIFLNIKNKNQKRFLWCILAFKLDKYRSQNPKQISLYLPYEKEILMENVTFPVAVFQIAVIERLNDLRIDVFGVEDSEIIPLHTYSREDKGMFSLLLIINEERQLHYCLIRNSSRLLSDRTKHKSKSYYCY